METLESIRGRMHTAQELYSVVRVMKALAAVSIRQYERAVVSLGEYNQTMEMGLQAVLRSSPPGFFSSGTVKGTRLVALVIGTDQGMCGPFNEQIVRYALAQVHQLTPDPKERTVLVLGSRATTRLEDQGQPVTAEYGLPTSPAGITPVVEKILVQIEDLHLKHGIERVFVYHHHPASDSSYCPLQRALLPLDHDWLVENQQRPWPTTMLPLFTLDAHRLFSALVRHHLFASLYRAIAGSLASENASRLAAMQAAEKNISEHLTTLQLYFHQQRQQAITSELLDIVSGAESQVSTGHGGRS